MKLQLAAKLWFRFYSKKEWPKAYLVFALFLSENIGVKSRDKTHNPEPRRFGKNINDKNQNCKREKYGTKPKNGVRMIEERALGFDL